MSDYLTANHDCHGVKKNSQNPIAVVFWQGTLDPRICRVARHLGPNHGCQKSQRTRWLLTHTDSNPVPLEIDTLSFLWPGVWCLWPLGHVDVMLFARALK